jgi:hypothetical protein
MNGITIAMPTKRIQTRLSKAGSRIMVVVIIPGWKKHNIAFPFNMLGEQAHGKTMR